MPQKSNSSYAAAAPQPVKKLTTENVIKNSTTKSSQPNDRSHLICGDHYTTGHFLTVQTYTVPMTPQHYTLGNNNI